MIKLKMKKEERKNSTSQDINELLSSSKDVNNVWTFKDVSDNYNKYKEELNNREDLKKQKNIEYVCYFIYGVCVVSIITCGLVSGVNEAVVMVIFCWLFMILGVLLNCIRYYSEKRIKRIIRNNLKGKEHNIVNLKDFLKNVFYEKYKEAFSDSLLQYVIDKLYGKYITYEELLKLNLDDEYDKIKNNYIELKNKKDELSLLRSIND